MSPGTYTIPGGLTLAASKPITLTGPGSFLFKRNVTQPLWQQCSWMEPNIHQIAKMHFFALCRNVS